MPDTDALAKRLVQGWYVQWHPSVYRENDPHGYDALVSEIAAALSAARAEAAEEAAQVAYACSGCEHVADIIRAHFRTLAAGQGGENG